MPIVSIYLFIFIFSNPRFKEGRDWMDAERNQLFGNAYSLEIERVRNYYSNRKEGKKENDLAVEQSQNEKVDSKTLTDEPPVICKDEVKARLLEESQRISFKVNNYFEKQAEKEELKKYNEMVEDQVKQAEEEDKDRMMMKKVRQKIKEADQKIDENHFQRKLQEKIEELQALKEYAARPLDQIFNDIRSSVKKIIVWPVFEKTIEENEAMKRLIEGFLFRMNQVPKEEQERMPDHDEIVVKLRMKLLNIQSYLNHPEKLKEVSEMMKGPVDSGSTSTCQTSPWEPAQSVNEQTDSTVSVQSGLPEGQESPVPPQPKGQEPPVPPELMEKILNHVSQTTTKD